MLGAARDGRLDHRGAYTGSVGDDERRRRRVKGTYLIDDTTGVLAMTILVKSCIIASPFFLLYYYFLVHHGWVSTFGGVFEIPGRLESSRIQGTWGILRAWMDYKRVADGGKVLAEPPTTCHDLSISRHVIRAACS